MAYLFNSLSDDQGADAGKQNIFGGQQTDQGVTSGDQGAGGGQDQQSSSAPSGGGGGGASKSSGGGNPPKVQGGYNPQGASQAYSTAASSMKMPTEALNKAEGSLAQSSQNLQDQANAYSQKAQQASTGFGLDEGTLSGAAAGKGPEYQKTSERLRQSNPSETYEAFGGLKDLPSFQNLRDPSSLYRAESGPNYSAGQARLDASFLRSNPEFIKRQRELLGQGKALEEESSKRAREETEKARSLIKKSYDTETGNIRGKIGGMADSLISKAKEKETAEDLRRAGLDPKALAAAEQEKIRGQLREDFGKADPYSEQGRAGRFLDEDFDLSPYVNIDKDTDWREFIGAPEAEQYNRLEGLLGNADMLTASAGGPGEASEFNAGNAYQAMRDSAVGKRQKADIAAREKLAAIEASAGSRLSQTQQDLRAQYQGLLPDYQAMRNAQTPAGQQTRENGMVFTTTGQTELPEYQEQDLNWQNMLTPDEVEELNATQADLGVMNPTAYQNSSVDPYAKNKALQDEIARWKKSQIVKPAKTYSGGGGSSPELERKKA